MRSCQKSRPDVFPSPYTYDELGRRAKRQINGLANEETHVYDPVGRIERIVNPLGQFDYEYVDPTGRLDKLIYPNGQITNFSYHGQNNDFRLQKIENLEPPTAGTDPFSKFEYTYTATGMIDTWKQQAGTGSPNTWTFGYDRADQLSGAVLQNSSSVIQQSFGYGYDNAGNRTHERKASGELDETPGRGALHNENNQLTSYSDAGAVRFAGEIDQGAIVWVDGQQAELDVDDSGTEPVQTFETWLALEPGINQIVIDAVNAAGLASQQTYEVNVADQGSVDFYYDAAGNMTERTDGSNTTRYRWDAENRLVEIIYPDDSTTEFQYDGFGRRVRIHERDSIGATLVNGNRTFVWDSRTVVEERDGTGGSVVNQFFDYGFRDGPTSFYYTRDHLGSVREVTDDQGTMQARYNYGPYGQVEQVSGTFISAFLFTGHFYHARSTLHLTPYRVYDGGLGRWFSRDPLALAEVLPEGPNLYRYVAGNPVNHVDSLGLFGSGSGITGMQWGENWEFPFEDECLESPTFRIIVGTGRIVGGWSQMTTGGLLIGGGTAPSPASPLLIGAGTILCTVGFANHLGGVHDVNQGSNGVPYRRPAPDQGNESDSNPNEAL